MAGNGGGGLRSAELEEAQDTIIASGHRTPRS
jgi:hypothetical protein